MPVTSRARSLFLSALAVAGAAVVLAAPALWNGFPLLYWDSADYMAVPFTFDMPEFRTAGYLIVTVLAKVTGTLWSVVAAQALLVAGLLHEVLEAALPGRARRWLVPLAAGLTLFAALPWFIGQLMPDALTGALMLGLAVLAFGPHQRSLSGRRVVLVLALAVATAVHTSHLALGLMLLITYLALATVARLRSWPWLSARFAAPALVVVLGAGMAAGANWAVTGRVFITQPTGNLMLARLVQDGIAKDYLDAVCPAGEAVGKSPYLLCPFRNRLPATANGFLWYVGPFVDLGGWKNHAFEVESAQIVRNSLVMFPWEHFLSAIKLTLAQLVELNTGDGIVKLDTVYAVDTVEKNPFMPKIIGDYYPADLPAYWLSEQRNQIDFTGINRVQVPLALAGYGAVLVVLGWALRRRDRLAFGLSLTVVLAVLGNAFVCGALSNPNHRYQARIAWCCLVAAGLGAARLRRGEDEAAVVVSPAR